MRSLIGMLTGMLGTSLGASSAFIAAPEGMQWTAVFIVLALGSITTTIATGVK